MEQHDDASLGEADEAVRRLTAFGAAPLDPGTAERCRARYRAIGGARRPAMRRGALIAVVAATAVVGSVGLAAADTLPDPVQEVAHDALGTVGVRVPPGHDRYNDPAACPGGPYRNHGAYVRAHKDDPNAGASRCGKPVKAGQQGDDATPEAPDADDPAGHGNGPPPWAHGNGKHGQHGGKSQEKSAHSKESKDSKDSKDSEGDDASDPHAAAPPAPTTSTSSTTSTTTSAPETSTTTVSPEPTTEATPSS